MRKTIVFLSALFLIIMLGACVSNQTTTEEKVISINRNQENDFDELFDFSVRHTFIIDFTQEEFNGLINDMEEYYDQYGTYRSNNYRKVDITYIADEETFTIYDVGYRSKGNIFSRYPPVDEFGNYRNIHFVLKFNETFDLDESTEVYQSLKTREVFNLEKLIFKWNRQVDESYVNEAFCYETFRNVGVPAPYVTMAEVQLKVEGDLKLTTLYTVIEHYDEEFVRKHLQEEPSQVVGDLYKVKWGGELSPINDSDLYGVRTWETNSRPVYGKETNKDVDTYQTLIDFTHMINQSDSLLRKEYLETNLDVDSFIRYLSISVLLGSPDDYRGAVNNYYLYFDEYEFATIIPYDYDYSMGEGWDGVEIFYGFDVMSSHNPYTLENDIYNWGMQEFSPYHPYLVDIILSYDDYQILYENYMEDFINNNIFSEASYHLIYDLTEQLYEDKFAISYNKTDFINSKIQDTLLQINNYRNERDG